MFQSQSQSQSQHSHSNSVESLYPLDPLGEFQHDPNHDDYIDEDYFKQFDSTSQSLSTGSFQLASKEIINRRPIIPISDYKIRKPHIPKNLKEVSSLEHHNNDDIRGNRIEVHKSTRRNYSDEQLIQLCFQGWNLSKGLKKRPVLGAIKPTVVYDDIKSFTNRLEKARGKPNKGATFGIGEKCCSPERWPNDPGLIEYVIPKYLSDRDDNTKFEVPGPKYYPNDGYHPKGVALSKSQRTSSEKSLSPGPIYNVVDGGDLAPRRSRGVPVLNSSGRTLLGSIYYDGVMLQSNGNYYESNEAYLNHSSYQPALSSPGVRFAPAKVRTSSSSNKAKAKKMASTTTRDPVAIMKRQQSEQKLLESFKAR